MKLDLALRRSLELKTQQLQAASRKTLFYIYLVYSNPVFSFDPIFTREDFEEFTSCDC